MNLRSASKHLVVLAVAALWFLSPAVHAREQSSGAVPSNPDDRTIHHVLDRLGFGARPGDVARVRQMGLANYIDQQLTPERVPDAAVEASLARFSTLTLSSRDLATEFFIPAQQAQRQRKLQQAAAAPEMKDSAAEPNAPPAASTAPPNAAAARQQQVVLNELIQSRLLRETMSERQLNEVLVDFWFNHFNVFVGKGVVREYLPEYERDVIRPHVLGSFRDLLGAVAHSPAMLFYLDNWQSAAPNQTAALPPQIERRLNNPRATPQQRAQMQQRLQQLQMKRPAQPRGLNENYARELMELHTLGVDGGYTQQDVIAVARALTGWTIDQPRQGGSFVFRAAMHDRGDKIILGQRFPAGHGEDEGERVLDLLASHPATAHHIAFELAQRFIADEPPPAAVDRAAAVFLSSKGDLRAVVRSIVTSPEFFAPAAYRAKVKTPLEFVVSVARASGATVMNAQPLAQALRAELGMPLYGCQPPTGYSNTADTWVNTGALLNRMNFALRLVSAGGRGIRIDTAALVPNVSEASRTQLVDSLLGGDVSAATMAALSKAETPQQLLALTLGSPEFQRR
jgi:uncharacterized protein (DUF1800 family)